MHEIIKERLRNIENTHQVRVIYACESGSRAWGFPSTDSDYDVRFFYIHLQEWYLTIENKRDVIESVDTQLDIVGWDFKKTLQLFRNSNPPLMEWLDSPIIYAELNSIVAQMRELASRYYSPTACTHHYLKMAQGSYQPYSKDEQVNMKKCFYALRPILAIKWLEAGYGMAPMAFDSLLERMLPDGELKTEIQGLREKKRTAAEMDYWPRIEIIGEFIDHELERLKNHPPEYPVRDAPVEPLNTLFRFALKEAWI